jgi:G3E family GTPase
MADPGPVAQTFLVQDDIQENYELDGIITLIDGKHVSQHLDDKTDEVMAQVAFADRIIINKVDLISDEEHKTLKNRLQSMNSMAGLYSATMADAPIAELLDIGGFNVQRAVDIKPNFLEPEYPFEWGGIWQLPAGDHLLRMAAGPDPELSILMTKVANTEETPLTLAEEVFVEFSSEAETVSNGQALVNVDQHYQMLLQGSDEYEFSFSLAEAGLVAFFTEHTPEEFDLKLLVNSETEQAPVTEHFFDAGHTHDNEVSSASIEMSGLFNGAKLNAWLEAFLIEHGPDIFRMKGVVGIEGQDYRFVFQGVHMIFGSQAGPAWGDETPINRLVFIGKNLDESYIQKGLIGCLV